MCHTTSNSNGKIQRHSRSGPRSGGLLGSFEGVIGNWNYVIYAEMIYGEKCFLDFITFENRDYRGDCNDIGMAINFTTIA